MLILQIIGERSFELNRTVLSAELGGYSLNIFSHCTINYLFSIKILHAQKATVLGTLGPVCRILHGVGWRG